ncbi:MAG: hypothetical protein Q9191_003877 [Dirinaria sp. TL-2023a]
MSLEVDRRTDLPFPQQAQKEAYRYQNNEKESQSYAYAIADNGSPTPTQQRSSKRSSISLLAVALAVMTILAVVAAAVGGSIAEKRKNDAMGTGSTYTSAWTGSPFTVHCDTDYPGSDMLGIWVFTFADCIEACASWNFRHDSPQCYAVSYDYSNEGAFTEQGGMGNCFLKGSGSIPANVKNVTSSAQASFSGSSSG